MRVNDRLRGVAASLDHTLLDDLLLLQVLVDVQEALCEVDLFLGRFHRGPEFEPVLIRRLIHCSLCRRW